MFSTDESRSQDVFENFTYIFFVLAENASNLLAYEPIIF